MHESQFNFSTRSLDRLLPPLLTPRLSTVRRTRSEQPGKPSSLPETSFGSRSISRLPNSEMLPRMLLHDSRNCRAHLLARLSLASMTFRLAAARIKSSRFFSAALSASPLPSNIFRTSFRTKGCCPFNATGGRPRVVPARRTTRHPPFSRKAGIPAPRPGRAHPVAIAVPRAAPHDRLRRRLHQVVKPFMPTSPIPSLGLRFDFHERLPGPAVEFPRDPLHIRREYPENFSVGWISCLVWVTPNISSKSGFESHFTPPPIVIVLPPLLPHEEPAAAHSAPARTMETPAPLAIPAAFFSTFDMECHWQPATQ